MKKLCIISILIGFILTGCNDLKKEDYWAESDLCDSKDECIELGDEYGDGIFDELAKAFRYSNQMLFWFVGLDTDQYVGDEAVSFDNFIIAEYGNNNNTYEHVSGEEHAFFVQMHNLIAHLLFDSFIELPSIVFLSEGYPFINIFGEENQLGIPTYLETFPSHTTLYLLLHELGHAVTMADLNQTEACLENYNVASCFTVDSYMQKFAEQFWSEHPEQWLEFDYGSMDYQERRDFHDENDGHFVSVYASISPQEDIAETFTHFVLSPYNNEPATIAEEKVNFFYEFDELVEYRTHVLQYLQKSYEEKGKFY